MAPTATPGPTAADPTAVVARRFLAAAIDLGILYLFSAVFWLLASQRSPRVLRRLDIDPCSARGFCTNVNDRYVAGWPMVVLALVWLVYMVGVFVLQRGLTGRTVGTMLTGVVTVGEDGRPLGIGKALLRSVAGVVDWLPCCLPLVGLITIYASPGHRRVGDMAASSYVVGNDGFGRPVVLPGPVAPAPPTAPAPTSYPPRAPTAPTPQPPTPQPPTPQPPTLQPPTPQPPAPFGPQPQPSSAPPGFSAGLSLSPSPSPGGPSGSDRSDAPGGSGGPVWDWQRQAYIQWDRQREQWLQFDQATQGVAAVGRPQRPLAARRPLSTGSPRSV